jgi:hypothetical protein
MAGKLERWRGNSRANSAFEFSHFAASSILIPSTGRVCCSLWRNADNSPISQHPGHGQCHASIQRHLLHSSASLVDGLAQVRSVVASLEWELWRGSQGRSSNLRGSAPSPPCSLVPGSREFCFQFRVFLQRRVRFRLDCRFHLGY